MSRCDLLIINRSFWPNYPALGEALLSFSESFDSEKKIEVLFQSKSSIYPNLTRHTGGGFSKFNRVFLFSSSASKLSIRTIDSIFFSFTVIAFLLFKRPKKVYISTDPPIISPFIVAILSKILKYKFYYHIQDIHPEALGVIRKVKPLFLNFLRAIDNFTIKQADQVITLTEQMKSIIHRRTNSNINIHIVHNPASIKRFIFDKPRQKGFVFTGNAGRFQLIPLLISAIREYHIRGGLLPFCFVGVGYYQNQLKELAKVDKLCSYQGMVNNLKAAELILSYEWALLPINDKVTNYAFPSKSSTYAFLGSNIFAICGEKNSVHDWVKNNKFGIVVKPDLEKIIAHFFKIERGEIPFNSEISHKSSQDLSIDQFVRSLKNILSLEIQG